MALSFLEATTTHGSDFTVVDPSQRHAHAHPPGASSAGVAGSTISMPLRYTALYCDPVSFTPTARCHPKRISRLRAPRIGAAFKKAMTSPSLVVDINSSGMIAVALSTG